MKKMMQFRYNNFASEMNYPDYDDYPLQLTRRNIFANYNQISQLGIQAPPGVIFYLNNGDAEIMVGRTGIYELDLEGVGRIYSIRFDPTTLNNLVTKDNNARLIIDIIYDGG